MAEALERARESLGDVAYSDATARGAAMTLDEIVAYVFSVLDVVELSAP